MPQCKPDVVSPQPKCPIGFPLKKLYCRRGGKRCPTGYICHIHPTDIYAVCCPACPGLPLVLPVGRCSRCRSCPGDSICTPYGPYRMCCPPGKFLVNINFIIRWPLN